MKTMAEQWTLGSEVPGSKLAWTNWIFRLISFRKKSNRHFWVTQFAGNAHWPELSLLFSQRTRPSPLNFKNEYLVLALGEETAVHAAVGSIAGRLAGSNNLGSGDERFALRGSFAASVCRQLSLSSRILAKRLPPTFLSFF